MGEATPTDPRAQRNRAGRRGGQLLTRALGPLNKIGLPTLLHSQRPCPGRSHRTPTNPDPPEPSGRRNRSATSFIPVTNAIESVNACIRRAVKARGHFPNEQAALKCVYLAIMGLDPTGQGRRRWMIRWKPALNAFDMTFDGRLAAGRK